MKSLRIFRLVFLLILPGFPSLSQAQATALSFEPQPLKEFIQSGPSLALALPADSTRPPVKALKPVVYSTVLLGLELGGLFVIGHNEDIPRLSNIARGFQIGPVWDDDSFLFNWVLHPINGSETYLRAREGNFRWWGSFLFSTAASVAWEFFIEGLVEQPTGRGYCEQVTTTFTAQSISQQPQQQPQQPISR